MPNTREKLIELLKETRANAAWHNWSYEESADHLIANGVTVQEWIPVTERLPDKMGKYICQYVFGENTEYPFYQVLWYFTAVEKPHFQHEGSMGLRVTHWMPLPEPPKGE